MESAPARAKSSTRRSGRSTIRCTSSTPSRPCTRSRSASTTSAPMVIGGTKWPSMTSTWITRAPASITSSTCAPSRAKSAARIDGATRTSCIKGAAKARRRYRKIDRVARRQVLRVSALVVVLGWVLGAVLLLVLTLVERGDVAPLEPLAVGIDLVELVGQHPVAATAAVDLVDLAVADEEAGVALAAREVVAVRIADGGHVHSGERPEHVVAVTAVRDVPTPVGEDLVGAAVAGLGVVALAAGDEVPARAAGRPVGAGVAGDQVEPRAALDRVVAGVAVQTVRPEVAVQGVVAGGAEGAVGASIGVHDVVVRTGVDEVRAGEGVDRVCASAGRDAVESERAGEGVVGPVADDGHGRGGRRQHERQARSDREAAQNPVATLPQGASSLW